jgi:hypothetical protein
MQQLFAACVAKRRTRVEAGRGAGDCCWAGAGAPRCCCRTARAHRRVAVAVPAPAQAPSGTLWGTTLTGGAWGWQAGTAGRQWVDWAARHGRASCRRMCCGCAGRQWPAPCGPCGCWLLYKAQRCTGAAGVGVATSPAAGAGSSSMQHTHVPREGHTGALAPQGGRHGVSTLARRFSAHRRGKGGATRHDDAITCAALCCDGLSSMRTQCSPPRREEQKEEGLGGLEALHACCQRCVGGHACMACMRVHSRAAGQEGGGGQGWWVPAWWVVGRGRSPHTGRQTARQPALRERVTPGDTPQAGDGGGGGGEHARVFLGAWGGGG